MKTSPSLFKKLCLSITTLLLLLLALEVFARFKFYREDQKLFSAAMAAPPTSLVGRDATLRDILRLSEDERLIYELQPNLDVIFMGKRLTTNEHGFRGPSYSVEKKPGTYRIVGIGDSVMFGYGLADGQSYLRHLETALNDGHDGAVYEVINGGVPGYNTVMEVESLKDKWLAFDPDLVILGFCGNDLDLPNFIREKHNLLALCHCYLLELVDKYIHPEYYRHADLLVPAPNAKNSRRLEYDPRLVPAKYKDHVGHAAFEKALLELKDLQKKHGFRLLVLPDLEFHFQVIRAVCKKYDLEVIKYEPLMKRYMAEHGIEHYAASCLTLSDKDPHPSALTTQLVSRFILEYLDERGYLS